MTYTCPVCLWDRLQEPPRDHLICPCCATHFGYSDCSWTHRELREQWVAGGCLYWSKYDLPADYNPEKQRALVDSIQYYICPVCTFDEMRSPPSTGTICPCCAMEFGLHDSLGTYHACKDAWRDEGCPWRGPTPRPDNWDTDFIVRRLTVVRRKGNRK